jgi:hypothetical protein
MRFLVCTGSFVALDGTDAGCGMRDADARGNLDETERDDPRSKTRWSLGLLQMGNVDAGAHAVLLGYGNEMCGET